jgi:hypothetical protein
MSPQHAAVHVYILKVPSSAVLLQTALTLRPTPLLPLLPLLLLLLLGTAVVSSGAPDAGR